MPNAWLCLQTPPVHKESNCAELLLNPLVLTRMSRTWLFEIEGKAFLITCRHIAPAVGKFFPPARHVCACIECIHSRASTGPPYTHNLHDNLYHAQTEPSRPQSWPTAEVTVAVPVSEHCLLCLWEVGCMSTKARRNKLCPANRLLPHTSCHCAKHG